MPTTPHLDPGSARVPVAKMTDYLLDPESADGASKARFFLAHGFSRHAPAVLADALTGALAGGDVIASHATPFGRKWEVDVWLPTPRGTTVHVVTLWIRETGTDRPRLVTAYPSPRRARP